ncbi:MAG: hypothetical protein IIX02_03605, partial [Clostridia bacterium]|nr:hypothetical protein [Clostridia bacterium]
LYVNGVEKTIVSAISSIGSIRTQGTNEAILTIEKGESATVTLMYQGGSKQVSVKRFNTQRQENYMEINV